MADETNERAGELDERRIARGLAIVLPVATVTTATLLGVWLGPAIAILVLAGGVFIGAISYFWASLRLLSGDLSLPPEFEYLDVAGHAVDALASRRTMLIRALKDLDNERDIGKLEKDDHEQLSATYRNELKDVLRQIDATLQPFRGAAESLAKQHLSRKVAATALTLEAAHEASAPLAAKIEASSQARTCASCSASNDADAAFCKKCGKAILPTESSEQGNIR